MAMTATTRYLCQKGNKVSGNGHIHSLFQKRKGRESLRSCPDHQEHGGVCSPPPLPFPKKEEGVIYGHDHQPSPGQSQPRAQARRGAGPGQAQPQAQPRGRRDSTSRPLGHLDPFPFLEKDRVCRDMITTTPSLSQKRKV